MTGNTTVKAKYRRISAAAFCVGKDISVSVSGGSLPHIGAVSLAVYEPERDSATVSTICAYGHRDSKLSELFSKKLASHFKCTVSASAGVHIDNASSDDLQNLVSEAQTVLSMLIEKLEAK